MKYLTYLLLFISTTVVAEDLIFKDRDARQSAVLSINTVPSAIINVGFDSSINPESNLLEFNLKLCSKIAVLINRDSRFNVTCTPLIPTKEM